MAIGGDQLRWLQQHGEGRDEPVDVDGFGHVDLEAGLERSAAIFAAGERGERERGHVAAARRTQGADPTEEAVPILLRHRDVADEELRSELGEYLHRHRGRLDRPNHGAAQAEHLRERLPCARVIFDDENARAFDVPDDQLTRRQTFRVRDPLFGLLDQGQRDREGRTLPPSGALRLDGHALLG